MSDNPADHTHTYAELRRDAEIALHQMVARCGITIDPDLLSHSGMFYAEVDKIVKAARDAYAHLSWMDEKGLLTREEMPMLEGLRACFEEK
jgi:hypothetical protein